MPESNRITVGKLRAELARFPDTAEITFGSTMRGDFLVFERIKDRSGGKPLTLVQIELTEETPR